VSVAAAGLVKSYYESPSQKLVPLRQVVAAIPAGAPVAELDVPYSYLFFKLNRPVVFAHNLDELRGFLAGVGTRCLIVKAEQVARVSELSAGELHTVGTWGAGRRQLTVLATVPSAPSGAGASEPESARRVDAPDAQ